MAATDDDAGDQFPYDGKVMLAAVISLSVVISFVLLLHIYARWLLHRRQQQRQRRPMLVRRRVFREPSPAQIFPGHAAEARLSVTGVDPKVVAALPVFVYRAAEHEHGVECVVCLSAMEEEESGRRLPKCKHAFHVGCIDMWLASHATCPICRSPVRAEAPAEAEGDAAAAVEVVVESEEEAAAQVEELCAVLNEAEDVEVVVDMKEDESSSSSSSSEDESSSSSSSVTATSYSSSSSFGSSLMRMLSKGRS